MILTFSAKCSDCFNLSSEGIDYCGYPPYFLGGVDYIRLEIEVETRTILNWKPKKVKEWLEEHGEDS